MKNRKLFQRGIHALSGLILTLCILASAGLRAQAFIDDQKTLSPYFVIPKGDPSIDKIPLLSTSADVKIAGVIADVTIKQIYKNEGVQPIEAIYVFPASSRAAVYSMQMTIGERVILAQIRESNEAREIYEQARENGQSASLLEQERPNVFTMNVANIMPGDEILVEMRYTELLIPEGGIYEFVYPGVVGPRYSNNAEDLASNKDDWVKNPYTAEGVAPLYDFDIKLAISAGLPIQEVSCKTHEMIIAYDDPSRVSLTLKDGEAASGNRDVIIRYRLAGGKIESGLLLYEGKKENFFLAMIQPPARPKAEQIPAREYVFIVDISGSMYGYPLDVSKEMMRNLLSKLKLSDRFNILLFAGGSSLFSERSLEASEANIQKGIDFIDRQHGGGGTELMPALKRALALKGTENFARSFVILTDGYVSVEKEAFDLIRNNLGNANFFPFGIGSSVNRYLIEGMAHAGMGTAFVVTSSDNASVSAEKFRKYIQQPVLTNIKTSYEGFEVYDVEPLSMADVFAERPLLIFGKWKGHPEGSIRIQGITGEGKYEKVIKVKDFNPEEGNAALRYLWAREKIKVLDDYASLDLYTSDLEREVTALGLEYKLLTRYTSFVAIDNQIRNADGSYTTVNQPLPLPDGVSNYAIGGISPMMQGSSGQKIKSYNGGTTGRTMALEELSPSHKEKDDLLFSVVETLAEFTGHELGVYVFISEQLRYPLDAIARGLEGEVFVKFTIEKDGSLSDIEILSSTETVFDQEAERLIRLTDKQWIAAMQGELQVRSSMIIKVVFQLTE